jgi:hypothetical protein
VNFKLGNNLNFSSIYLGNNLNGDNQRVIELAIHRFRKPSLLFAVYLSDIREIKLSIKRFLPWLFFSIGLFSIWAEIWITTGFALDEGFLSFPLLGSWSVWNYLFNKSKKLILYTKTGKEILFLDTISDLEAERLAKEIRALL